MVTTDSNDITQSKSNAIPPWASSFMTAADFSVIEAAVAKAESQTSGEIVPMIVGSSVPLGSARRLLVMVLLVLFFALSPYALTDAYDWKHIATELGIVVAALGLGLKMPIPSWLLRVLVPENEQVDLVQARAELEFYRSHMSQTAGQTGILLFVSLAEHRAVVLADKAISSKLSQSTWDEVLKLMLSGFKAKNVAEGFAGAIAQCGEILRGHFPRDANDKNELHNHLQFKD